MSISDGLRGVKLSLGENENKSEFKQSAGFISLFNQRGGSTGLKETTARIVLACSIKDEVRLD